MLPRLGTLVGYCSDTTPRIWLAVLLCASVLGAVEFSVNEILATWAIRFSAASLLDATIVAVLVGVAAWLLLTGSRESRQRVRRELEQIAELNHEIRNALEVIAHGHFDAEPKRREMVMASVQRIDAVLKRVVPVVGGTR